MDRLTLTKITTKVVFRHMKVQTRPLEVGNIKILTNYVNLANFINSKAIRLDWMSQLTPSLLLHILEKGKLTDQSYI